MPFQAQTIEINGNTLALQRGGKGPPLLFLHGAVGLTHWPQFLDNLAERYDVIAPDHPGFGQSPSPGWMDDISDLAYFYLDAMQALDLRDAHVVGHSLGGWIALEMAVRSQEHIRDLTLLAPAGIHVKGQQKTDIFMIDPDEQARLAFADPQLGAAAAEQANAVKYQDVAIRDRIAAARFGWNPRFYNPRLGRWLHRVAIPSLVIWGEKDMIFPPALGKAFQDLIPGAELVMLADCGHLPQIEKREQTLAAMQNFMVR